MEERAPVDKEKGGGSLFLFRFLLSLSTSVRSPLFPPPLSTLAPPQALRCSNAAPPPAALAASVAAAAESSKALVLSALATVLPDALTQQLARLSPAVSLALSVAAAFAAFLLVKKIFDTPSRKYDPANPNVGDEYDAWTR